MSKQYVERSDVLQQIEEAASQIAGQSVQVAIRAIKLEADQTAQRSRQERSRPARQQQENRRRVQDLNQDAFVEQAISIFGGTLVDVREIHEPIRED